MIKKKFTIRPKSYLKSIKNQDSRIVRRRYGKREPEQKMTFKIYEKSINKGEKQLENLIGSFGLKISSRIRNNNTM